jgi:predicted HNH restriction endonuclease
VQTWIFQGNPEIFDIDGYLHEAVDEISWLVSSYQHDIDVRDTVYIWKSQGKEKEKAGIVAECEVLEQPRLQPNDPAALRFWRDEEKSGVAIRVRMKLLRVANKKEVLKRDWLSDDSALHNLLILRRPAGTNFSVTDREAARLKVLWSKIGQDWKRDEVVAALHLYASIWDKPISKTVGSPVERLSQQLGRVPTGVYNKLMNLRSIDPRDDRKGLPGGSAIDREVWAEFFDIAKNDIDQQRLNHEYERLWESLKSPEASEFLFDEEISRLEEKSFDQLMDAYRSGKSVQKPRRREVQQLVYERRPLVIAIAKKRAGYSCEIEGCPSPTFVTSGGEKFVEVHHLIPLAQGGEDSIANTVCLCPTHHREIHHGKMRQHLTSSLQAKRVDAD